MIRSPRLFYAVLFVATILFAQMIAKCAAGFAAVSTGEVVLRSAE